MSNKPSIHIRHLPTNDLLCGDGCFRSGISGGFGKSDTLLYRSIGHALRRLRKVRKDMRGDTLLEVCGPHYGSTGMLYWLDADGKRVDVGHDGKRT
jgi:hypothetical protein